MDFRFLVTAACSVGVFWHVVQVLQGGHHDDDNNGKKNKGEKPSACSQERDTESELLSNICSSPSSYCTLSSRSSAQSLNSFDSFSRSVSQNSEHSDTDIEQRYSSVDSGASSIIESSRHHHHHHYHHHHHLSNNNNNNIHCAPVMNMNFDFGPDHASSALDVNNMNSPVVLGMNMSADILLPLDMAGIDTIVGGSSLPIPYGLGSDQELINSIEFYDLVVKMERLAFEVVKLEHEQKQKLKSVLRDLEPSSVRSSRGVRLSSTTSVATATVSAANNPSSSSSSSRPTSHSMEQDMQVQVLIPLDMYLDAIMELVPIVRAFKGILPIADFVEGDITKNVNNARAVGQRLGRSTVQELCIAELSSVPEGEFVMSGSGVEALVWLKRTVQFMQCLMANLVKLADKSNPQYDSVGLTQIVQESYDIIYSPVHPFFLRSIVRLCFNALPSKESFIATLGMSEDAVVCGLERVVRATCMFLHIIVYFFKDLNLNMEDVHNVITLSSS